MSDQTEYILTIDPGKDSTKSLGIKKGEAFENIKPKKFLSRLYDLKNGYIEVEDQDSHRVIFDKEEFIIGKQGGTRIDTESSKEKPLHRLCTYTAISTYMKPKSKNNKIHLVMACPINTLKDDAAKESYRNFIKGTGPINLNIDGNDNEFEIVDLMFKSEASGVRYLRPDLFSDKKVLVVDFGGLNMSVILYNNGICVDPQNDRFAENFLGSLQLIKYVADSLTEYNHKGNRVKNTTAEEALNRGCALNYGVEDEKSIPYIKKARQRFFDEACDEIAHNNISLQDLDSVVFVGGTSQYLKDEIAALPNGKLVENSQFTTVEGLFKIALKKYNK